MFYTIAARLALVFTLAIFSSNCGTIKGWFSKKKPEQPPEVMAKEGIQQLRKKKYLDAAETFEKLRDRYPYSEEALLAQIKLADSHFYKKSYEEALQAYRDFE